MSTMHVCVVCGEEQATIPCFGYGRYFCSQHMVDHEKNEVLNNKHSQIEKEIRYSLSELQQILQYTNRDHQNSIDALMRRSEERVKIMMQEIDMQWHRIHCIEYELGCFNRELSHCHMEEDLLSNESMRKIHELKEIINLIIKKIDVDCRKLDYLNSDLTRVKEELSNLHREKAHLANELMRSELKENINCIMEKAHVYHLKNDFNKADVANLKRELSHLSEGNLRQSNEFTKRNNELNDRMKYMTQTLQKNYDEMAFNETKRDLRDVDQKLSNFHKELDCLRDEMANNRSFGVPFVDLSDTNGYKRILWSKTAPKWRKAVRGMCLEGFCENKTCEAYGQRVVIGIGMRKFDLLDDPSPSTTPCPMCKQYVEPTTCAFNNCKWRWEGTKQISGQPPMKLSGDWKQVDNAYHYFDQTIKGTATTSGTCIWRRLIIEAQAI